MSMGTIPKPLQRLFFCPPKKWIGRAIVGLTFVSLSATLSVRFLWEPQLKVGTFVTRDIRAPRTAETVDREATREAKERARQEVPQIYRVDNTARVRSVQHLEELLIVGDQIRDAVGPSPYIDTSLLSYGVQLYLRECPEPVWQDLQKRVETLQQQLEQLQTADSSIANQNNIYGRVVTELLRRRNLMSEAEYRDLINQIEQARGRYKTAVIALEAGPDLFQDYLLDLRDSEWDVDKQAALLALNNLMAEGLIPGLPPELRQYRISSRPNLPIAEYRRQIIIDLLDTVLIPNLEPDYVATDQLAAKAAEEVEAKVITLQAGEVIVRAGQQITEKEFAFLDSLGLAQRRPNFLGIVMVSGAVALAMSIFGLVNWRLGHLLGVRLKLMDVAAIGIVCTSVSVAAVLLSPAVITFIPFATVGLMLGSFYGSRLAALTTILLAVPLVVGLAPTAIAFSPILVGAILAALLTNRPHTRSHLATAGILVAIVQAAAYAFAALLFAPNLPLVAVATLALQYAAGGLVCSIVALGAIPYLEQVSYALTPIRLAELANLDRPLLRRLVTEAPGTFQHTLFVANLAEAGARAIGADTSLVRTGTLYHDVGKTLHPEFFIENQMGQPNPHDKIDDPWRSAQIIREHVTGGIKLAQKFRLPEQLIAFIPEHQGTITIAYFYHKAKAIDDTVTENDFRYEGPIPQSRETGVVMLADACEAALRSLGSDTTIDEAYAMVRRIFNARLADHQLRDANLSPEDLENIIPVFIKVWQERNHGRIKYPALAKKFDPTGSELPEKKKPPEPSEQSQQSEQLNQPSPEPSQPNS
ncbi:7TM receptor with intracellular metal dependent phosphohydrolase [Thalassoporum mexicanum PCC 7367]|uniref:HD family phosphohydrolase n=1 Tax=Thalassoporum mexicanum TaxID=3457544 RepID=UPI00029FBA4B|nr:HDIG domain-containing metalloprotein [Pseudanabaena sp. PCC 7367]AFY70836.1 7TM receptor with intracellular metal dependent phosphohydrolase [Pseudanabaena sp. PCC 7367]